MQPLVRYIRKSQILLKHLSQEVGQTLLNRCPQWPCWMLGQGELAQHHQPGHPLLRAVCVAGRKVTRRFAVEGKHHSQKGTDCLIFSFYYII